MTTPLVATARIEANWTVHGKAHKARLYCAVGTFGVGGASTILDHDGSTTHTLTQVTTVLFPLLNNVSTDDNNTYVFQLQNRVGPLWILADETVFTTGSGSAQHNGWESIWIIRMEDQTKVRLVLMEGGTAVLEHTTNGAGSVSVVNAVSAALSSGASSTHNPFRWIVGRSGNFVAPTGAFVSFTNVPNRKMRRERGLG
jgi:hypothetical protein